MDRSSAAQNNRTDQCNKDDPKSGPGRPHAYQGKGDKDDLDNHSRQMDPKSKLGDKKKWRVTYNGLINILYFDQK